MQASHARGHWCDLGDTYSLFETTYKNNFDKRDIELALAAKLELPIPGFGREDSPWRTVQQISCMESRQAKLN